MSTLREQISRDLQLKGYSPSTQKAYINSVRQYAKYHGKPPNQLGEEEIKSYLHYLQVDKKVSDSFLHTTYSGLKFFYETTLGMEWDPKRIPRSKKSKKLPYVLDVTEINALFDVVNNIKHKAILMTIYGAGLRVSEATHLKLIDIDSKTMQIRINQAKGKKDRYTILSEINLGILRDYWKIYRPGDWLFYGESVRMPITERTIQKVFTKAKEKAGIHKPVTVHSLRHSFATHLLEAGVNIFAIQKLMGHSSVKTTSVYIHIARPKNVVSPLDQLSR